MCPSTPPDPWADTPAVLAALAAHGVALLPSAFDDATLDAARAEAAGLLEAAEAAALSGGGAEELEGAAARAAAQRGCVFQVLPELTCAGHPARRDARAYWAARSAWPCAPRVGAWLRGARLRALLAAALGAAPLLFNEQHIIKLGGRAAAAEATAFVWHRDGDACREAGPERRYLSLWVALHDTTPDNGALVVLPRGRGCGAGGCSCGGGGDDGGPPAATRRPVRYVHVGGAAGAQLPVDDGDGGPGPVGLLMPAGSAVLFDDQLWHCSGPNASRHTRSAFMAQFCAAPLTWREGGELVGLAVPL
ncbi:hypothetical protein HT031_006357 [Scenedesmus sp. PABB004]|nr:hypothetical protein HT031_006357 [Scenedesmus sp. PABB004]